MGIFEAGFDVFYLVSVVGLSILMIKNGKKGSLVWWFGMMGLILGAGDSFHLVPRITSQLTHDFASHAVALGYGKMVTSITMTVFYLILYRIWEIRNGKAPQQGLRVAMGILAGVRVVLSLMPQNNWAQLSGSYAWGIYRNIPFAMMGILIVWLLLKEAKANNRILRLLYSGGFVCGSSPCGGCSDDAEDAGISHGGYFWLSGNESGHFKRILRPFYSSFMIALL